MGIWGYSYSSLALTDPLILKGEHYLIWAMCVIFNTTSLCCLLSRYLLVETNVTGAMLATVLFVNRTWTCLLWDSGVSQPYRVNSTCILTLTMHVVFCFMWCCQLTAYHGHHSSIFAWCFRLCPARSEFQWLQNSAVMLLSVSINMSLTCCLLCVLLCWTPNLWFLHAQTCSVLLSRNIDANTSQMWPQRYYSTERLEVDSKRVHCFLYFSSREFVRFTELRKRWICTWICCTLRIPSFLIRNQTISLRLKSVDYFHIILHIIHFAREMISLIQQLYLYFASANVIVIESIDLFFVLRSDSANNVSNFMLVSAPEMNFQLYFHPFSRVKTGISQPTPSNLLTLQVWNHVIHLWI